MKIEHYIAQLLYRYQCVTVPGFGAFLTEIQPAQIHTESNGFYPPKKLVSFNAYLKNNDGLLANHIAQHEKISYESAVEKLCHEVALWKSALLNKQAISITNIGVLALNTEGNIIFEASNQVNYYTIAFGLSAFVSPLIKREDLTAEPESKQGKEPVALVPVTRNYSYLKYAALVVAGLGTFGFFGNSYYENRIEMQTQLVHAQVQKAVQHKIQEATFFIARPLPNVTLPVKETKMPYHIVAGAFRKEDNARRIFEKLKELGYQPRRLEKNKYGLFPVLYGSYTSYAAAQQAMREIHKTQSREAWLLVDELN